MHSNPVLVGKVVAELQAVAEETERRVAKESCEIARCVASRFGSVGAGRSGRQAGVEIMEKIYERWLTEPKESSSS